MKQLMITTVIALLTILIFESKKKRRIKFEADVDFYKEHEFKFTNKKEFLLSALKLEPALLFPVEDIWIINELVKRGWSRSDYSERTIHFRIDEILFRMVLRKDCLDDCGWGSHVKVYQVDEYNDIYLFVTNLSEGQSVNGKKLTEKAFREITSSIFLILCCEKKEIDIEYDPFKIKTSVAS